MEHQDDAVTVPPEPASTTTSTTASEPASDALFSAPFHKGVLAGLSEAERDDVIMNTDEGVEEILKSAIQKTYEDTSIDSGGFEDLCSLLSHMSESNLWYMMGQLRLEEALDADVKDFPKIIADELLEQVSDPIFWGQMLHQNDIELVEELVSNGGRKKLAKEDATKWKGLPVHMEPFVFILDRGDHYEFTIPSDVLPLLDGMFWEAAKVTAEIRTKVAKFVQLACELRGVTNAHELHAEYERFYDEDIDYYVFEHMADISTDGSVYTYFFFEHGPDAFFVDSELIEELEQDEIVKFYERATLKGGERPLTSEMVASRDLGDWRFKRPESVKFRNFVDEHIPDGENDLGYADNVFSELSYLSYGFYKLNDVIEWVLEMVPIGSEEELKELLNLTSNLLNNMPCWQNSGWSPNEMLEMETGHRLFFDDDGKPIKVGRNDPCPCGSGKKYKKCCGA